MLHIENITPIDGLDSDTYISILNSCFNLAVNKNSTIINSLYKLSLKSNSRYYIGICYSPTSKYQNYRYCAVAVAGKITRTLFVADSFYTVELALDELCRFINDPRPTTEYLEDYRRFYKELTLYDR